MAFDIIVSEVWILDLIIAMQSDNLSKEANGIVHLLMRVSSPTDKLHVSKGGQSFQRPELFKIRSRCFVTSSPNLGVLIGFSKSPDLKLRYLKLRDRI